MAKGRLHRAALAVAILASAALVALAAAASAAAATKPEIRAAWSTEATASSARLRAEINPEGSHTTYHFNYITQSAYQQNIGAGKEGFAGALKAPAGGDPSIGEGSAYIAVVQSVSGLSPATAYRYRLVATNAEGSTELGPNSFSTQALGGGALLADSRGWEMVSPVEKNGGQVQGPEENYGGDVLQAAADGQSATYTSSASFGQAAGNPGASQYLSRRTEAGWATENITAPTLSGAYGEEPDGVPYRLFSGDLSSGLLLNGEHCRIEIEEPCPVANPPLPGSGAPAGYQDYYLRNDASGSYASLLTASEVALTAAGADTFSVSLAGATPDLAHIVLSTCSKLTPEATEVAGSEGCDPEKQNLYEWTAGALRLINILPLQGQGTPGAVLGAQAGAISADGAQVYFTDEGSLYLREGTATKLLAAAASFQTATPSGAFAFYTTEESPGALHLYRYNSQGATSESIATGVKGVLGASRDGSYAYYQDATGLKQWHGGTITQLAAGPEAAKESDWPPGVGSARVSADGSELLFLSTEPLSGYDNTDPSSPAPCPGTDAICDSEVFLWSAAGGLTCISCNPTGERPLGPSSIPGALANGTIHIYQPRVLAAAGQRVFFETTDGLVLSDTNRAPDAYEWEAAGVGSCAAPGGCVSLISSGRSAEGGTFVDASASGADAFFLTGGSLVGADPGSVDLYDARVGGGFPEPPASIPCEGDACQPLPSEPEDPEPGTEREGAGNPPLPQIGRCKRGLIRRHGKCVKHKKHKKHRRGRRG
jgi:hypothetical protein